MLRRFLAPMLALTICSLGVSQTWQFIKINPKGTYLRDSRWAPVASRLEFAQTEAEATAANPLAIGTLQIRTVGWYNRALDNPASRNIDNVAAAVFSDSLDLDPDWSKQHRVAGAHDAGDDFDTLPTWEGSRATDIGEDFGIFADVVSVELPHNVRVLYFTPYDNGFWNNGDDFSNPGSDPRGFGVEWRVIPIASVPEPTSSAILAAGAMALLRRRSKRVC